MVRLVEPLSLAVARVLSRAFSDSLMTQKELERRTGISQGKISVGMRGIEPFTIDQLDVISDALGIDPEWIVHEARAKRSPT